MPESAMFVDPEFVVPATLEKDGLVLIPLGPEHNAQDYAAWTSSVDQIKNTPGFEDYPWPHPMTMDENLRDLEQHQVDFAARQGFTYTVLKAGDVVGCVYIYPGQNPGQAAVRSWVRADHADLDKPLYELVSGWLSDQWTFAGVEYAERP